MLLGLGEGLLLGEVPLDDVPELLALGRQPRLQRDCRGPVGAETTRTISPERRNWNDALEHNTVM